MAEPSNDNPVERRDWEQFRESGLLWWTNRILHVFGWAIAFSYGEDGEIVDVFPVRTVFRGFDGEAESDGFVALSRWMRTNAEQLEREAQS